MGLFKLAKSREIYLKEKYQEKINEQREDFLSKVTRKENKIHELEIRILKLQNEVADAKRIAEQSIKKDKEKLEEQREELSKKIKAFDKKVKSKLEEIQEKAEKLDQSVKETEKLINDRAAQKIAENLQKTQEALLEVVKKGADSKVLIPHIKQE